jgi:hypothetical protein
VCEKIALAWQISFRIISACKDDIRKMGTERIDDESRPTIPQGL